MQNMQKIFLILFLVSLSACSPWKSSPVTDAQITALERSQGVNQWKQSQATTDGCSSPQPIRFIANHLPEKNWEDCCWQHDFDYGYGVQYGITEKQANYELWACVSDSGHPFIANAIYDAVKIFGWRFYQSLPSVQK